jgi:hypothetical protein
VDINKIQKQLNLMSIEMLRLKKENLNYSLHARQTQKSLQRIIGYIYKVNPTLGGGQVTRKSKSKNKTKHTNMAGGGNEVINITIQPNERQGGLRKVTKSQ